MLDAVLTTAIWFAACGVATLLVSRWYVSALLAVSRHGRISKFGGGTLLWLGFSLLLVAALFGALLFERVREASSASWLFTVWIGLAFLLSLAPAAYYIGVRRIRDLRHAGYFLNEDA